MSKSIFVTGGAGFIGSELVKYLLEKEDFKITIYDNLSSQVHLDFYKTPFYNNIKNKVNFILGDIRDFDLLSKSLKGHKIIFHFASETGTGQSMYQKDKYVDVNVQGTHNIIKAAKQHDVEKIILSSSRSVYGEGKYLDENNLEFYPKSRDFDFISKYGFEIKHQNKKIIPVATDENSLCNPTSIYGLTKLIQEDLVLDSKIPYIILRYQNVYGPGQSLLNPYTGIISVFSNMIYNNKKILIFEDGSQTRDFIFIDDVTKINFKSVVSNDLLNEIFNIGTGQKTNVLSLYKVISSEMGKKNNFEITMKHRLGDIRHNFADVKKIKKIIKNFNTININQGIERFVKWFELQDVPLSLFQKSMNELIEKDLYK